MLGNPTVTGLVLAVAVVGVRKYLKSLGSPSVPVPGMRAALPLVTGDENPGAEQGAEHDPS